MASNSSVQSAHPYFHSPTACSSNIYRASDLFMSVSVSADVHRNQILDLASKAANELVHLATTGEPYWLYNADTKTEILEETEYQSKYGPEITLGEAIKMILSGESSNSRESALVPEASRATGIVPIHPVNLCNMFMSVNQWTTVFSDIVSKATLLAVLCPVLCPENPHGALQVMMAEFHVPSPLVKSREYYFARYCKRSFTNTWVVVDVSLGSIIPNQVARCQRRPSGCVIELCPNGSSKIIWVENNEVDNRFSLEIFNPLLWSGYAFNARRWVCTLARQCDRVVSYLNDNVILTTVVVHREGRMNLMRLAGIMVERFNKHICPSKEHPWHPLSIKGVEDIVLRTSYNIDVPGIPRGITLAVSASVHLNIPPKDLFEFLRCGDCRDQWDVLSCKHATQDVINIPARHNSPNCVSVIYSEHEKNPDENRFYLQESYNDGAGYYVVYSPVDIPAMNMILNGGDPERVDILTSGFSILPDKPTFDEQDTCGSLLTIAFQMMNLEAITPEYVSAEYVIASRHLITQTVRYINEAMGGFDDC